MALIVQKYGGSSVADTESIKRVAKRVVETEKKGNKVAVVVSAMGDTTDDLIAKAAEITSDPSRREMDMLLAAGEEISIALLAMAPQMIFGLILAFLLNQHRFRGGNLFKTIFYFPNLVTAVPWVSCSACCLTLRREA